jgi:hypothetical protein
VYSYSFSYFIFSLQFIGRSFAALKKKNIVCELKEFLQKKSIKIKESSGEKKDRINKLKIALLSGSIRRVK